MMLYPSNMPVGDTYGVPLKEWIAEWIVKRMTLLVFLLHSSGINS